MAPRRGAASDVASMHTPEQVGAVHRIIAGIENIKNRLLIAGQCQAQGIMHYSSVTYSDARADGFPCHEALALAAIDGMNPTPIGYSEIRDAAEAYNSQVEEKLKVNRGRFRQTLKFRIAVTFR